MRSYCVLRIASLGCVCWDAIRNTQYVDRQLPLFYWYELPTFNPIVQVRWADEAVVVELLYDVAAPAHDSRDYEDWGVERDWYPHHIVCRGDGEIEIGVEAFFIQHDALEGF